VIGVNLLSFSINSKTKIMDKKLTKKILEAITSIVEESEGYKISFDVRPEPVKSFWGKTVLDETIVRITLSKQV
jgi:hypothetical protein